LQKANHGLLFTPEFGGGIGDYKLTGGAHVAGMGNPMAGAGAAIPDPEETAIETNQ
jgi:hypothetical protein